MAMPRNIVDSQPGEKSDSGVRRMTAMLREGPLTEGHRVANDYRERARSKLDDLKSKMQPVRDFIAASEERTDLSSEMLRAETISAKVVVALYDSLERLYSASSVGNESYPLKCISVASNSLSAFLRRGNITQQNYYPTEDKMMSTRMIISKDQKAREIHTSIVQALEGSNAAGVPAFDTI